MCKWSHPCASQVEVIITLAMYIIPEQNTNVCVCVRKGERVLKGCFKLFCKGANLNPNNVNINNLLQEKFEAFNEHWKHVLFKFGRKTYHEVIN